MGRTVLICTTFLAFCQPCVVPAAEETSPAGELRTDSTPNSISMEWDLAGDSNHDATCNVQYRQQGSGKWLEALPLFRVDYQWWYHTQRADKPVNMFAGSLIRGKGRLQHNGLCSLNAVKFKDVTLVGRMDIHTEGPTPLLVLRTSSAKCRGPVSASLPR